MNRLHAFLDRFALHAGVTLLIAAAVVPVYFYGHEPRIADPEFPDFVTRIYGPRPPAVYRLVAEDGFVPLGTALLHAAAGVLAALRIVQSRRNGNAGVWPFVLAFALAGWWCAVGPGAYDRDAPTWVRYSYPAMIVAVASPLVLYGFRRRRSVAAALRSDLAAAPGMLFALGWLLTAAARLLVPSLPAWLTTEPPDYAPAWLGGIGALAVCLSAAERYRREGRRDGSARGFSFRLALVELTAITAGCVLAWNTTMAVTWLRTPLYHFGVVVDGAIYRSGQPRYRDLWLAQKYYGFRTIVNLHEVGKSPYWDEEQRFAREHGIRIVPSTATARELVAILRDPQSWPVLVHCRTGFHRTTAMLGLYWCAEQGWTLDRVFREIERVTGMPAKPRFVEQLCKELPLFAPARFPEGDCELPPPRVTLGPASDDKVTR